MRILVIDDERSVVELLRYVLSERGYTVTTCDLGESGLRQAMTGEFALILLDVGLPDRDGWSILEALRSEQVSTPVLLLTAYGDVDDRIKGFDLGADDYLTKPFDVRELLSRVQAVTRRAGTNRITAGDLVLHLDTRHVTRGGLPIHLSPQEFGALLLLVRNQGEVVTHQQLSTDVLKRTRLGASNAVEVLIRRLRQKVDARFPTEVIRTVRGQGYTLATGT